MVKALTASMIIDSTLITFSSLHAITEMHIANRHGKECDCDCNPDHVFHNAPPEGLAARYELKPLDYKYFPVWHLHARQF